MRNTLCLCSMLLLSGFGASTPVVHGQAPDDIGGRTAGMQSQSGFIPVHYEVETGRLFLEVTRLDEDFIYANALAQGLGSDQLLLDRGHLEYRGRNVVARFERHGSKIMLVAENMRFRAQSDDAWEKRAVAESFPSAVYAALPIEIEEEDGRFLVDATEFFLSDAFDVEGRIESAGEGDYQVDRARSHIFTEYTRVFPDNTEIRAALTFETDAPGEEVREHAPDGPLGGRTLTVQQHHSFVRLPPPGFSPRKYDPRVGSRHTEFRNFAQGFDNRDYTDRYIWRWRLDKEDPDADISEPVEPIVVYMDQAIQEPYRTAFIEGLGWWNETLEAAGFRNAIQIRDLPDGADPMDVRFSTILLLHRTGPGMSTAPSIKDPRTGEILHAIVRMDSHRSLTDYNYYMGLVPALRATNSAIPVTAEEMAMLRRKQHVAHEFGHALGFEHNHLAATLGRASVMDYPAPLVDLDETGRLDISGMYRDGPGAYDSLLVRYAYTPTDSPEDENDTLGAIVREGLNQGLRFLSPRDAALGGSYPGVHQWVEGTTMIDALERTLAVREVLLRHFNEEAIREGERMAILADRLAHVYLHHRYSLQAAIKYVGGMEYTYAVRGDGQTVTRILPGDEQHRALELILSALEPSSLKIPERVSEMIPPTPYGFDPQDRWIQSPTGAAFDPLALARAVAAEVVDGLLLPERAARVVSFHARDPSSLSLDEVVSELADATWNASAPAGQMDATLLRVTQRAVLDGLLKLAAAPDAPAEVRSVAEYHLMQLRQQMGPDGAGSIEERAHRSMARRDIDQFIATGEIPELQTGIMPVPLPWP